MHTIKQTAWRQAVERYASKHTHHSLLLYCCAELSLTPNIISATGEQENINNDAVFSRAETAEQLPTNSRKEKPSLACQT